MMIEGYSLVVFGLHEKGIHGWSRKQNAAQSIAQKRGTQPSSTKPEIYSQTANTNCRNTNVAG